MPKLELTVGQVIDLVKQLPQKDKFTVLKALNQETETGSQKRETESDDRSKREEQHLRTLSAERGLDWDRLSEDDRDVLAKNLLHNNK